jgi:hypothetical protein
MTPVNWFNDYDPARSGYWLLRQWLGRARRDLDQVPRMNELRRKRAKENVRRLERAVKGSQKVLAELKGAGDR